MSRDVDAQIATVDPLDEVEALLSHVLSWAKVVIDAKLTGGALEFYSVGELAEKFAGWIVKPLTTMSFADGKIELGNEVIGISLFRAFVDRQYLEPVTSNYVGTFDGACADAERVVGELARLGAELHVGIELAASKLPLAVIRRRLDELCRENYGIAGHRRHGRLYLFLSHACSLQLPHVLRTLDLCKQPL